MTNRFNLRLTQSAKRRVLERQKNCEDRIGQKTIVAFVYLEKDLNKDLSRNGIGLAFYYETQREELKDDLIDASGLECVIAVPIESEQIFLNKLIDVSEDGLSLEPAEGLFEQH